MKPTRSIIRQRTLTLVEYYYYVELGVKRAFFRTKPVRVIFNCTKCNAQHISTFHNMRNRNQEFLTLCTKCAGSLNRSKMNTLRAPSYYMNEEYRRKISAGVKAHYKNEGQSAIDRRHKVKMENFELNGYPDFSTHKLTINNVYCASYGEGVFVQWKLNEGYTVQNCKFVLPYTLNGVQHHYRPDFIISKEDITTLIEVKCDYLRNFRALSSDKLINKSLLTYALDELECKIDVANQYSQTNGWQFELVTFDDKKFNYLYNQAKRIRRENRKQKNDTL